MMKFKLISSIHPNKSMQLSMELINYYHISQIKLWYNVVFNVT